MPRINLSLDDNLYSSLQADAKKKGISTGTLILMLLEQLYSPKSFNYQQALRILEQEAQEYKPDTPFVLHQLPSFRTICVAQAEEAALKPSIIRARLGKMLNRRIAEGKLCGVSRKKDGNGNLEFLNNAAVYIRHATEED